MNVEFHPEAMAEFSQAVEFYEERQPLVGVRFRVQIVAVAHCSRWADYWLDRLPTNQDLE